MISPVSQSPVLRNSLVWGAAFFSLLVALIISDVSVIDAFLILSVISVQTLGGILIYRWCSRAEISPSPEYIGMGFAIGSFLAMIGDQFALGTPLQDIGWLLPVLLGVLAYLSAPKSQSFIKSELRLTMTLPWAIAGSFLALGLEWYWSFPVGIAMVAVLVYLDFFAKSLRSMNKLILIVLVTLLGGVIALMLSLRPEIWWIEHFYDFLLYENWSNALSSFGRVGIGGVGYEFNYHWFTYAWNGLISRLSSADPWVATTRSSILISVVVIQLLLSAIIKQYGIKNRIANLSATIVAMFSTVALWRGDSMRLLHLESFSGVFALVWLLAVFLLVLKARESFSMRHFILIVVLCIATFGAKTAFGGVAVVLIFALFIEALLNRRNDSKTYLLLSFVSLGSVLLLAKYLFLDSYLPKIWGPSLGFIEFLGAMESENLIFRKHETAFLALWWISAALLVQILAAVVFAVNHFLATRTLLVVEVIAASSCVGLLCVVTFWDGNQNYFAYAAFVVLLPLVASFLFNNLTRELLVAMKISRLRLRVGFVLSLIVAFSILTLRMPEIGVATRSEVFLRHLPYLASTAISLAVILIFFNQIRSISNFASRVLPSLLIIVLSITSVTFYISEWSHEVERVFDRWEREGPGKVDTLFGSQDIQEAIQWINANTETDSIIAIDYDTPSCPIDPWGFRESQCAIVADQVKTQPHMGREVLEGAIKRQMLIRNLHPLTFGFESSLEMRFADIEAKRIAIRDYSLTGDVESLKSLQKFGVSWFVINLEQADGKSSWSGAEIEFRNKSFVILKLPKLS
jgi:hypothetical protein